MTNQPEILVRDVMSRGAHLVGPDDPIDDVFRVMKLGGTRHMPVVEGGRLVGVVSDRDVLVVWTNGGQTPVSRVMTRAPRWVSAELPAREAARLLLRHKVGCLPVVDEAMTVVGIITETDFLELAHRALGSVPPVERPSVS